MASYPYGSSFPGVSAPAPGAPPGGYFPPRAPQAGGPQYGGPGSGGGQYGGQYGGGGQYGNQPPGAPPSHYTVSAPGGHYGGSAPGAPYGAASAARSYPGQTPASAPPGAPYGGQTYGISQQGPYSTPASTIGGVPAGVDPEAYSWFRSVDADSSGFISMKELKQALVNTNWSTFNDETCYLMINMFDKNKLGKIDVYGFSALWRFLQQWRNMFQQFDRDRSGSINSQELQQALSQMGYNLSPQFTQFLVARFAERPSQPTVQLDSFIHICTQLQSTSEAFREKDTSRSGNIRVSYEDFLTLAVSRML